MLTVTSVFWMIYQTQKRFANYWKCLEPHLDEILLHLFLQTKLQRTTMELTTRLPWSSPLTWSDLSLSQSNSYDCRSVLSFFFIHPQLRHVSCWLFLLQKYADFCFEIAGVRCRKCCVASLLLDICCLARFFISIHS